MLQSTQLLIFNCVPIVGLLHGIGILEDGAELRQGDEEGESCLAREDDELERE